MTKQKIVTGVVLGAAAGALIGYLFATEEGASIRKKIVEKSGDLGSLLKSKAGEWSSVVKDEIGNLAGKAGSAAEQTVSSGKDMAKAQADKWSAS